MRNSAPILAIAAGAMLACQSCIMYDPHDTGHSGASATRYHTGSNDGTYYYSGAGDGGYYYADGSGYYADGRNYYGGGRTPPPPPDYRQRGDRRYRGQYDNPAPAPATPGGRRNRGDALPGDLKAGGAPKEIAVNRSASRCIIEVTEGSVIINTVVVREGGKKTAIRQGIRLQQGQRHMINFGGVKQVTGLRISDDGRGSYRVAVQ